jgi:carbon-monoxide dehydrogenase medium subunit
MSEIQYQSAKTVKEAVKYMQAAKGKGYILAGGTDLLVQMKSGARAPGVIVNVKKIPEMVSIVEKGGAFTIGAATPAAVMGENKKLRKAWPGVIEACNLIGSTQVQGRASAGGNLCNASPAADSVPALVAAGCIVNVAGPNGKRAVPVEQFCTGPGKTSLKTGEIVVSLTLPKRPKGSSDAYLRLIPRTEVDIAVVGVGVSLTMKGDTVTDARVGLGAVAPTVLLVDKAAKALIGSKLDDAALDAAADACSAACRPIDDKRGTIKYRTKIAGVLLKRSAMIARDRINGIEHRGHRPVYQLQDGHWLNTARFPQMTFRSTEVELTGPNTASIAGELALHGVMQPVTLTVTFNGGYGGHPLDPLGARIGFSAHGSLMRSAFGISEGVPPPGSNFGVGDNVEILIEAEFTRPATPAQ